MSDGSLSQDEINALLGDFAPTSPDVGVSELSEVDINNINSFLTDLGSVLSETMTGVMVKSVNFSPPKLDVINKQEFLLDVPEQVVEISASYNSGLEGFHLYVLSPQDALNIATPMMGQDNLEINDTSIGAVAEAFYQVNEAALSAIENKIGMKITTEPGGGQNVPKTTLGISSDRFARITWNIKIEDGSNLTVHEIFALPIMQSLASQLTSSAPEPKKEESVDPLASLFGDTPIGNADPLADLSPGIGTGAVNPQVQGVELPNLVPNVGNPTEQRNIELLMDVSMEIAVELGRTRWKIKDILSMGEGTIVELDKLAGEPVDILVNNNLMAKGEVVVIDENFGVRITEIVSNMDRLAER